MAYEIYTYGGGESLWYVFNAVAALLAGPAYLTLIKIAGVAGLLWALIEGAFSRRGPNYLYLLFYLAVYGILFVPKANVVIVDRVVPAYSGKAVANVPWGLALFGSTASKIGDWLTRATEAGFSVPDSGRYSSKGMLFNTYLIEASTQWVITDENFAGSIEKYMRNCVFYDILLGRYTWKDLVNSKDIWRFITDRPSQIRGFKVLTSLQPPVRRFFSCAQAAQVLTRLWKQELRNAGQVYGAQFYHRQQNRTSAAARLMADLPTSYAVVMGISKSAADLVRQNMMVNLTRRALRTSATGADAGASVVDFAQAQAEATMKVNMETSGRMAAKILPLIKNILEALVVGLFPFALFMMFLPIGGAVIKTYLSTLVWVQLWAPLYAILNLFMQLSGDAKIKAAADLGFGAGPSIATNTGILYAANDTASIAGYMSLSIPVIAWMLVSAGRFAATQLATNVVSAMSGAAAGSATGSASGNLSLGNVGAYNTTMFQNKTSPSADSLRATRVDAQGATQTYTASGDSFYKQENSVLRVKPTLSQIDNAAVTEGAKYSEAFINKRAQNFRSAVQGALNSLHGYSSGYQKNSSVSRRYGLSKEGSFGRQGESSVGHGNESSDESGGKKESALTSNARLGSSSGRLGKGTRLGKMLRKLGSLTIGVSGSESSTKEWTTRSKTRLDNALKGYQQEHAKALKALEAGNQHGRNQAAIDELKWHYSRIMESYRSLEASHQLQLAYDRAHQRIRADNRGLDTDLTHDFKNDLQRDGMWQNYLGLADDRERMKFLALYLGSGFDGRKAWQLYNRQQRQDLRAEVDRAVDNGKTGLSASYDRQRKKQADLARRNMERHGERALDKVQDRRDGVVNGNRAIDGTPGRLKSGVEKEIKRTRDFNDARQADLEDKHEREESRAKQNIKVQKNRTAGFLPLFRSDADRFPGPADKTGLELPRVNRSIRKGVEKDIESGSQEEEPD